MSQVTATQPGDAQPKGQSWPDRIKEYFSELQAEMRKVNWPSRAQVQATTGVVIAAIFAFGLYFWGVDMILSRLVDALFRSLAR